MQAKPIEFIKKVTQNVENLCDSLSETDYTYFVESSSIHIELFKQEVDRLIRQYNKLATSTTLGENEKEIIKTSQYLCAHLEETNRLFKESMQTINQSMLEAQEASSLYNPLVTKVFTLQETMNQDLHSLYESSHSMHALIENSGIITLYKRLQFCTEVFLKIPYTQIKEPTYFEHYKAIADALSDFWYNEGIDVSVKGKQITTHHESDNLLLALVLSFITAQSETSLLSKSCYLQLINRLVTTSRLTWGDNSQFSFEYFSKKHAFEFIALYEYLFNQEHEFSNHIAKLLQEEHVYVHFHYALFQLHAARACDTNALLVTPQANDHRKLAFAKLVFCHEKGLNVALEVLEQHLPSNVEVYLEEYIYLALFYFKKDKAKALQLSQLIYEVIQNKSHAFFNESLAALLTQWVLHDTDEMYCYALTNLDCRVRNRDERAYEQWLALGNDTADYAVLLAKCMLFNFYASNFYASKVPEVIKLLERHNASVNNKVPYYQYLLKVRHSGKKDYRLLVQAVELNNKSARRRLTALCYHENAKCKWEAHFELMNLLNHDALFVLDFLYNCLANNVLTFNVKIIDNLIQFFYPYVLRIDKELADFLIDHVTAVVGTFATKTYEFLVAEAKSDFHTALVLIRYWLKREKANCANWKRELEALENVLLSHYDAAFYAEKTFGIYWNAGHVKPIAGFKSLVASCMSGSEEALDEIICIFKTTYKAPNASAIESIVLSSCMHILSEFALKPNQSGYLSASVLCVYFIEIELFVIANRYSDLCGQYPNGAAMLEKNLKTLSLFDSFNAYKESITRQKAEDLPVRHAIGFFEQNAAIQTQTKETNSTCLNTL